MTDLPPTPQPSRTWKNAISAEMIAVTLALSVQTGTIVWWASSLSARVSALETKATAASHQGEDIARIDERTKAMQTAVEEIARHLDEKDSK